MPCGLDRPANARTGRVSPVHASHDVERATVHVPREWTLWFPETECRRLDRVAQSRFDFRQRKWRLDDELTKREQLHFALDAAVFPNAMSHFFAVSIESGGTRSSIEIRLFPDRNER